MNVKNFIIDIEIMAEHNYEIMSITSNPTYSITLYTSPIK